MPCSPRSPPTPASSRTSRDKGDGGAQISGPATGASGGESYRDPFAPDFWTKQVEAPAETEANRQTAMAESQMTEILKSEDAAAEKKVTDEGRGEGRGRQDGSSSARRQASRDGDRGR